MLSIRFKRILTSVQAKPIINVLIILVLAFVSSYPAFTGHFFALSNDGAIHLARLESLYQAFKVEQQWCRYERNVSMANHDDLRNPEITYSKPNASVSLGLLHNEYHHNN